MADKGAVVDDVPHFDLPVDSERKAKTIVLWKFSRPHMRSFHLNWIAFFTAFLSTFAAAPLIPVIRQDLNLTKSSISGASVASVTGTIAARVFMGSFCDAFGPRFGQSCILILTSSAVFGIAAVTNSTGFIICRCLIGFSLASFVACQFWTSIMFSPNVVGTANAIAGGWGNMGGGFTQLLMPLLLDAISHTQPQFVAWRWAYFVPGGCHLLIGFSVLFFAQDLPDGNYAELKKKGEKEKSKGHKEFIAAITNYRTWVLLLTYGYCFGVELTIDNNLAQYFVDNFNLSTQAAGNYAAIFGMLNIVSRPCGGIMSDFIAKRIGIRGRIWWLYSLQLTGGVFCIVLGLMKDSLTNTVVVLIFFSFFLQAACGATYGLVPFISRRALGLVCGLVGAGGSTGSAVTQAIFFTPQSLSPHMGIVYMGVMICGITQSQLTLYWPMWGGALCGPKKGATEEDYYFSEYSEAERKQGLHRSVMKFANESRSMRGMKRIQSETSAADLANPKADVV